MTDKYTPVTLRVPDGFADLLKDLTREVLRSQPSDIPAFCAHYFKNKLDEREGVKTDSSSKSESKPAVTTTAATAAPASAAAATSVGSPFPSSSATENMTAQAAHAEDGHDHEDARKEEEHDNGANDPFTDDEDDEEEAEAPPPPVNKNRGRRESVSAESMAPTTDENFEKVVIPKSAEQRSRIEASIQNNFLFKNLDEDQYKDVVDAMSEKKVETGEDVIKQGGVGDFFYVVEIGTLDVFVSRDGQGKGNKVTSYSAGGSFGELALMYNAPRAATVTTTSPSTLWALDRVTFRRILMENTSRKRRMYEGFLEEVTLLSSLEPYERHKIADALESNVFNDGDVVIRQGEAGQAFFLIESGECKIVQTDESGTEHELPGLKKGDYFGELALLNDQPRVATVIAKGKLKVASLNKKAFVRLLGPLVDIMKRKDYSVRSLVKE